MALQLLKLQNRFTRVLNKYTIVRYFAEAPPSSPSPPPPEKKGLVLGVYAPQGDEDFKLTEAAAQFDRNNGGKITDLINEIGDIPLGQVQVYHNFEGDFYAVAVAGLGSEEACYNKFETLDEAKENTRIASGVAARALQAGGVDCILVEPFNGQTEAAAEGACLGVWRFQDTKNKEDHKAIPALDLYNDDDKGGWQRGINKAEAQNIARRLSEMPANLMTPTLFAQAATDYLCPCGVQVMVRDKEFLEDKKLTAILAVSRGSCEQPVMLELNYTGAGDDSPIVIIGKGVTHDVGGMCLKRCEDMFEHKADMSGAAAIVGAMRAIAALNLPLNVTGVIPLCENVPSGMAIKPGDVIFTTNGRSVKVENTDMEGPLILADAFIYAQHTFQPKMVIDVATLTCGMREALGEGATGAFVTNDKLWEELEKAGAYTGDRVWRMPLWDHYTRKITRPRNADLSNVGVGPGGSPCLAAAFLREFIPCGDWIHLDTHGTGMLHHRAGVPYMKEGRMTGRPTRTLIQFLQQIVNFESSK